MGYMQHVKKSYLAAPSLAFGSTSSFSYGLNFTLPGKEYTENTTPRVEQPKERSPEMPHLSRREMQLVLLVRQAKTNKEIAAELCLSPGTAKQYLHVLFRKLGIRNRTELAMWGNLNLGGLLAASGEAEPGAYS